MKLIRKNASLFLSTVLLLTLSSCLTQEILFPTDNTREYQSDMVSVCKSYLNLYHDEVAEKLTNEFKRIPWSTESKTWVKSLDETVKVYYENDKAYRIDYQRSQMSLTQSQMMDAALTISQDVYSFYTANNPSTYNCGELLFKGDENKTKYDSHSDFISALKSGKDNVIHANESWGSNTKGWSAEYNESDGNYVEFKLDLSK